MDIFWNHTICLQNPSILTDKHTDKHTDKVRMDIPGVVGGSKAKMPSMGGMDIFWNHTICLQNPSILTIIN